jgi:hypothetical protein
VPTEDRGVAVADLDREVPDAAARSLERRDRREAGEEHLAREHALVLKIADDEERVRRRAHRGEIDHALGQLSDLGPLSQHAVVGLDRERVTRDDDVVHVEERSGGRPSARRRSTSGRTSIRSRSWRFVA